MKKKTTAQQVGLYIPHSLLAYFKILWYFLGLPTAHFSVFDVVLEDGEDDRHDLLLHIFFGYAELAMCRSRGRRIRSRLLRGQVYIHPFSCALTFRSCPVLETPNRTSGVSGMFSGPSRRSHR